MAPPFWATNQIDRFADLMWSIPTIGAARTDLTVRKGFVAMTGPVIDTPMVALPSFSTIVSFWLYGARCAGFLFGADHGLNAAACTTGQRRTAGQHIFERK